MADRGRSYPSVSHSVHYFFFRPMSQEFDIIFAGGMSLHRLQVVLLIHRQAGRLHASLQAVYSPLIPLSRSSFSRVANTLVMSLAMCNRADTLNTSPQIAQPSRITLPSQVHTSTDAVRSFHAAEAWVAALLLIVSHKSQFDCRFMIFYYDA